MWGVPISVSIEPTTACNLSCPECPSGLKSFTRSTGTIRNDAFRQKIDKLFKETLYLNFYFQGEPFLHKNFLDMVAYASSKGMYTVTSTNAHFFDDDTAKKTIQSGLDRLIVSIDGTTQDIYEQYRIGGDLSKVLKGVSSLVSWKKKLRSNTPMIVFQYLVVKPNEHQIDSAKELAKELGVDDIWFKTAQVYDHHHDPNGLIPTIDKYSRYKKLNSGESILKGKMKSHCWKMWHSNVITWDGNVVPCCFDKDASHVLGNLVDSSMREIWKNNKYEHFRQELMKSRKNIDICSNCSEGLNVWAS
jgi:radical SAM protein with 4Fe4S-binding SPASM domain